MGQERCMHNDVDFLNSAQDFHDRNVIKEMFTSKIDSVLTTEVILNIGIDAYV